MEVTSTGVLPASSVLWQPRAGAFSLTVVCKATFLLAPTESPLAPDQDPILHDDEHWNDDAARSLRAAGDLAPLKPSPEVVLVGHAFAPGRQPVRSLVVRLIVGDVDKAIEVFGDRAFDQQGALHEGALFARMPLVYERASGGPGTWNPAGVRFEARDLYGRRAMPNLQPPGMLVTSVNDFIEPIGFGPIAASWPWRRNKLGRYAATWSPRAIADAPLPEDLDRAVFQVAPPDQRVRTLRDNERIVLDNLHPDHPHLVTSLAGVHPRAIVAERSAPAAELPLCCDTLVIDTDRLVCTLVWRGQLSLSHPAEPGRVIVATELAGQRLTAADIHGPAVSPVKRFGDSTIEIEDEPATEKPDALPFTKAAPSASAASWPAQAAPPAPADRPSAPGLSPPPPLTRSETMSLAATNVRDDALAMPFRTAPPHAGGSAAPDAAPPPPVMPPAAVKPQTIGMMLADSTPAAAPAPVETNQEEDAAPRSREASRDLLALIWFDNKSLPRIERKPQWQRLLDALEDEPIDPEFDDPVLSTEPRELEERAHVFEILDRAAATDLDGIYASLARAGNKRGRLTSPLQLCDGDLVLPFDEVETLKAVVSTASPIASGDEALAAALAIAKDFLGSPAAKSAPAVAEGLTARIRETFQQGRRNLPADHLDAQVERALLEERHYQKRKVLGGAHLRSLLTLDPSRPPVVAYLPAAVADDLPLAARFRARMIAEAHLGVDEREAQPLALKVIALGRVVLLPER